MIAAGHRPAVITGDGARRPAGPTVRPGDRAGTGVPYPWVAPTRTGGRVLTPGPTDYHDSALLVLGVAGDGAAPGR